MILLTGAAGFIGRRLLKELVRIYGNNNILAFTSKPIENYQCLLHNNYNFNNDIFLLNGYADKITTIIHAGAFTPKYGNEANDITNCNSNIFSLSKILECEFLNLEKIIYLSTLDVYDSNIDTITEESLISPVSLYGHSKLYGEKMIIEWVNKRNKIFEILRIGHVYGPGEEAYQKIIPITIKKILKNETLQIWGTGNEIRSFIYIDDVIKAISESILSLKSNIINIVGSQQITINELVNTLLTISNVKLNIEILPQLEKGKDYIFDNSKMKQLLLPEELPLLEGLEKEFYYMANMKL